MADGTTSVQPYSPYTTAFTTILGVGMNVYNTFNNIDIMKGQLSSLRKNNAIIAENTRYQMSQIDEQLSMMLMEGDLNAIKAEARMKAGSAETGVSGRSVREATAQVFIDNAMSDAVIISNAQQSKIDVARRGLAQSLQQTGQFEQSLALQPSAAAQFLSGVNSGLAGYIQGLNLEAAKK